MNQTIYADSNGSVPPCAEVKDYLQKRLMSDGPFGNPNALHGHGRSLHSALEKARKILAQDLGAKVEQVFFNSGSTEGINTVFHSVIPTALKGNRNYILVSAIEHPAVLETARQYEKDGAHIKILRVTNQGVLDLDYFQSELTKYQDKIALVAVMAANNETGVLQPFPQIAKLCQKFTVPFLCDTTQFIGKNPFHFEKSEIDFAVISSHKIGGIPGSGILIAKNPTALTPFILGGGQEKNHRSGTQNYLGIEAMAIALHACFDHFDKITLLEKAKKNFEKKIQTQFKKVVIIGENVPRLFGTTALSYPGIHGQAVQIELESRGIFVTTSSACSDNEPSTSHVLKAMQFSDEIGRGVIRISLSVFSEAAQYEKIADALAQAYKKLAPIGHY